MINESQICTKLGLKNFQITDDEIIYVEKILLPNSKEGFDDERKKFIKNLETIDLQAVPGSGKTTALLAKLIILEKKMPFEDGSGILVLSHTNAAINEIKNKLQHICPKLFQYPNFIGTVQSFVDRFLAIPCGINIIGAKISHIDDAVYKDTIWSKFSKVRWDKNDKNKNTYGAFYTRNIDRAEEESGGDEQKKKGLVEDFIKKDVQGIYYDFTEQIIKNFNPNKKPFSNKDLPIFKGLEKIVNEVIADGIISYDYAYNLGSLYLNEFQRVRIFLQKRFKYVFVDEMQDMEQHQYDLLEQIFFDEGNSYSIYQRIGDKNQAIHGSFNRVGDSEIWLDRIDKLGNKKRLTLNNSHRLSPSIASIVSNFGLNKEEISGKNKCELLPHILVFDDDNLKNVIPYFAQLVKKYKKEGRLINFDALRKKHKNESEIIKAIAWTTEWKKDEEKIDKNKIRLWDYCEEYDKKKEKQKSSYDNLIDYLICGTSKGDGFKSISNNIINALLKILRIVEIKDSSTNRYYTKTSLFEFLKEKDEGEYRQFRLKVYQWAKAVLVGKVDEARIEIINYIEKVFLKFFLYSSAPTIIEKFLNGGKTKPESEKDPQENGNGKNIFDFEGVEIELTSVHAVKGQTHCATLYLESYYKDYESKRLSHRFFGESKQDEKSYVKQSTKMMYVGLSRPMDLLCIAIHKTRFDKLLGSKIDANKIEIIKDISNNS